MSNPLHVLEDELRKLHQNKKTIEHDIRSRTGSLEVTDKAIKRYEDAINLLKEKEDNEEHKKAKAYKC